MRRSRTVLTLMIIMGLILVFSAAGCASVASNAASTLSIQEIDARLRQVVDLSGMRVGDETKLRKLYNISSQELDGFVLYTAPSNLKADELLILKAKGAADVASIRAKIGVRVDKQSVAFGDYLPEEYYLIQKHICRVNGNHVLFVISSNAEKIASAFDQIVK